MSDHRGVKLAILPGDSQPEVLTVEEASRLLRVSRWTLYAAINRNEIPHRRIGRRIMFSRRALVLWLEGANPGDAGKECKHAG